MPPAAPSKLGGAPTPKPPSAPMGKPQQPSPMPAPGASIQAGGPLGQKKSAPAPMPSPGAQQHKGPVPGASGAPAASPRNPMPAPAPQSATPSPASAPMPVVPQQASGGNATSVLAMICSLASLIVLALVYTDVI
ncbi:MAG: hypothetical protein AAGA18_07080 [Verrucomicrobiota bacterium]